jgi:hypothetical protein
MATTLSAPGLSDEERVELLALIKGADSVELKLTVPVADRTCGAASWVSTRSTVRSARSIFSTRRICC